MSDYYLPEAILEEIFSRLPGKSLMRFRSANKSFCALIDSPRLQSMHPELSNIKNNVSIMLCEAERNKLYTIDYKSICSLLPLSTSSTTTCDQFMNQMEYPTIFQDCEVKFLSSCNGMVWIRRTTTSWGEEYYIWNPATKIYKNITMPREVNKDDIYGYGFGYDSQNDNYKLVRVVVDWESECSTVDVYTLSSNSWKNTQSIRNLRFYEGAVFNGVLFHGALHWLARTFGNESTVLVCFNVVSEGIAGVASPEAPIPYPEEDFQVNVGVLGGSLCFVFHVFNVRVDVWMMQEYGVPKSWTKSFSITHKSIISSTYLGLVWSFKNNEILWETDQSLVLIEPKDEIYRELMFDSDGAERKTVADNYIVSSVPL